MLKENTIIIIEGLGYKVESEEIQHGTLTLFKGVYSINYNNERIMSIRETEEGLTLLTNYKYKPVGITITDNGVYNHETLLDVLLNIKSYYLTKENEGLTFNGLVKRAENWKGSMYEFLKVGDGVCDDIKNHFINYLPPVTLTSDLIQMGEPYTHVNGKPVFATLKKLGEQWVFAGNCFEDEFRNAY